MTTTTHLNTSLTGSNSFSDFQAYLEQGKIDLAFSRIENVLLTERNPYKIASFCENLWRLLPYLSPSNAEDILEKALLALQNFPALKDHQSEVLVQYGKYLLKKGDKRTAMRCFATAFQLNGANENLSSPLSKFIEEGQGVEERLEKAARKGNPQKFMRILHKHNEDFGLNETIIHDTYCKAFEIYKSLNAETKKLFAGCFEEILKGKDGRLHLELTRNPPTTRYREQLKKARQGFLNTPPTNPDCSRDYQKAREAAFNSFFGFLFRDVIHILGTPPCKYEIRVTGSFAGEVSCPYSDFEYFILIEDKQHQAYFKKLAEIFHLQILSLGETNPNHQGILDFGQKAGLEIDSQSNPDLDDSLIALPDDLFKMPHHPSPDTLKAHKSRLQSKVLLSNHSFVLPPLDLRGTACELINMRKKEFEQLRVLEGSECNVKQEFIEPLFHFISDLGLFLELDECNPLDLIEKLPIRHESNKALLRHAVSRLYAMRIRLHIDLQSRQECAALDFSMQPLRSQTKLTGEETCTLKWIREFVLIPLYKTSPEKLETCDFFTIALQNPEPRILAAVPALHKQVCEASHHPSFKKLQGHLQIHLLIQLHQRLTNLSSEEGKISILHDIRLILDIFDENTKNALYLALYKAYIKMHLHASTSLTFGEEKFQEFSKSLLNPYLQKLMKEAIEIVLRNMSKDPHQKKAMEDLLLDPPLNNLHLVIFSKESPNNDSDEENMLPKRLIPSMYLVEKTPSSISKIPTLFRALFSTETKPNIDIVIKKLMIIKEAIETQKPLPNATKELYIAIEMHWRHVKDNGGKAIWKKFQKAQIAESPMIEAIEHYIFHLWQNAVLQKDLSKLQQINSVLNDDQLKMLYLAIERRQYSTNRNRIDGKAKYEEFMKSELKDQRFNDFVHSAYYDLVRMCFPFYYFNNKVSIPINHSLENPYPKKCHPGRRVLYSYGDFLGFKINFTDKHRIFVHLFPGFDYSTEETKSKVQKWAENIIRKHKISYDFVRMIDRQGVHCKDGSILSLDFSPLEKLFVERLSWIRDYNYQILSL